MEEKKLEKKEILIVSLIFIISFIVRFLIANMQDKTIAIYEDELLYYRIAESIASGEGVSIFGTGVTFSRILYCFFIAPAFFFGTDGIQITVIAAINSLLLNLGIIPVYLLGKKIIENKWLRLVSVLIYVLGADMNYSVTFMSENVFIPYALFIIYFAYVLLVERRGEKNYALLFLFGVFNYGIYFDKAVGLAFPICFVFVLLITALFEDKEKRKEVFKKNAIEALVFLASFVLTLFIFKALLNQIVYGGDFSAASSISNSVVGATSGIDEIMAVFFGFFFYIAGGIIALGIFPAIMPLMYYKRTPKKTLILYIFLAALFVLTALVVAVMITRKEDVGNEEIRLHLRYVAYLYAPVLMCFMSLLESFKEVREEKEKESSIMNLVFGLIIIIVIVGIDKIADGVIDEFGAKFLEGLAASGLKRVAAGFSIISIVIYNLIKKNKKAVGIVFFAMIAVMSVCNNYESLIDLNYYYHGSSYYTDDALKLAKLARENPNKNILIYGTTLSYNEKSFDTYTFDKNIFYTDFNGYINVGSYDITQFPVEILYNYGAFRREYDFYYDMDHVDYIVLPKDLLADGLAINNELSSDRFNVYELENTKEIPNIVLDNSWWENGVIDVSDVRYGGLFRSRFTQKSADGITSGFAAAYAIDGPLKALIPGRYDVTVYYTLEKKLPYEKPIQIGELSVNGKGIDDKLKKEIVPLYSDQTSVTMEKINITDIVYNFRVRVYTTTNKVKITGVEISKSN